MQYEIKRSDKRRTLSIEVHRDQKVIVRAPIKISERKIQEFFLSHLQWIEKKLNAFEKLQPEIKKLTFIEGETHHFLGEPYLLKIEPHEKNAIQLNDNQFILQSKTDNIKKQLYQWYSNQARMIFPNLLNKWFPLFATRGHTFPHLTIRLMKRRWGSYCASKHLITLNTDLIRTPQDSIEYVIVHELCHMEHYYHNRKFYQLLTTMMPDWQQRKEHLKLFV